MKTLRRSESSALALALFASAALLASCSDEKTPPADGHDHGHEHADGDGHTHEDGDVHSGTPVVIHDGAHGAYTDLHVTYFRPTTTPVTELVFEIALTGPTSTVRGHVKSASGATSLTTRGEPEGAPGEFHLHLGELPADLGTSDVLVLELEPTGAAKQTLELSLAVR